MRTNWQIMLLRTDVVIDGGILFLDSLVTMFLEIEVPCQNIDFVISVFFVNSMGFGIVPP